jgi:hypothetical protein
MTVDTRSIETGLEIPSQNYCDQPYIVVTNDGADQRTIEWDQADRKSLPGGKT